MNIENIRSAALKLGLRLSVIENQYLFNENGRWKTNMSTHL